MCVYCWNLLILVKFHGQTFESVDEGESEQNVVDSHLGFGFENSVGALFVDWDMGFHLSGVQSLFFSNDWPIQKCLHK